MVVLGFVSALFAARAELRIAFMLQRQSLLLECVAAAGQHPAIQKAISEIAGAMNWTVLKTSLDQSYQWPNKRYRWRAILMPSKWCSAAEIHRLSHSWFNHAPLCLLERGRGATAHVESAGARQVQQSELWTGQAFAEHRTCGAPAALCTNPTELVLYDGLLIDDNKVAVPNISFDAVTGARGMELPFAQVRKLSPTNRQDAASAPRHSPLLLPIFLTQISAQTAPSTESIFPPDRAQNSWPTFV